VASFGIKDDVTLEGIDDSFREVYSSFAQIGMVLPFIGPITQSSASGVITTTAPPGWLWCDGDVFLQSDYPQLYQVLGSTTLPDLRGDFIAGTTNSGEVRSSYGSAVHSHTMIGTSPATSGNTWSAHESAGGSYGMGVPVDNHDHNYNITSNIGYYSASTYVNYVAGNQANVHLRTHSHSLSVNTQSSGTRDNHSHTASVDASNISSSNNHAHTTNFSGNFDSATTLVPQIAINYIIKADK